MTRPAELPIARARSQVERAPARSQVRAPAAVRATPVRSSSSWPASACATPSGRGGTSPRSPRRRAREPLRRRRRMRSFGAGAGSRRLVPPHDGGCPAVGAWAVWHQHQM